MISVKDSIGHYFDATLFGNKYKARVSGELSEAAKLVSYASQLCWCHERGMCVVLCV